MHASLVLFGCQSQTTKLAATATPTPTPTPKQQLTADDVLGAFKEAKLPIEDDVVFTDETDPNKLLGRPHQYIGKASWNDTRGYKSTTGDRNMTVEVFANSEDLENRRQYVDEITKRVAVLAEYQFVHKNALLRLHHALTPKQAAEYERVLKSL